MTKRPIYIPQESSEVLVKEVMIEFEWFPGLSLSQKEKCVDSLHKAAKKFMIEENGDKSDGEIKILEISTKSKSATGRQLSSFNLMINDKKKGKEYSVESAFQSAKVFTNGGPYENILDMSSINAKRDKRLKTSGNLISFIIYKHEFPLTPKTFFYDWLYINALLKHTKLAEELLNYQAFTDIEFNPKKSINCQAHSVALFSSLIKKNLIKLNGPRLEKNEFLDIINRFIHDSKDNNENQIKHSVTCDIFDPL